MDPEKLADISEKYFGKAVGRLLVQITILAVVMTAVTAFLYGFGQFVGEVAKPFYAWLVGPPGEAVSQDNIRAVMLALVGAMVVFVAFFAVAVIAYIKSIKRRVPLEAIDELSDLRGEGIGVFNSTPAGSTDADAETWNDRVHKPWVEKVKAHLAQHFSHAESMAFGRLGVLKVRRWSNARGPRHRHYLDCMDKELAVLEEIISRHLDRH